MRKISLILLAICFFISNPIIGDNQNNGQIMAAELSFSREEIRFDTTLVGKSDTDFVVIYNTRIEDLFIDSIFTFFDQFTVLPYDTLISPSDSTVIHAVFSPEQQGEQWDSIFVIYHPEDYSFIHMYISGFGSLPEPDLEVDPSVLIFNDTEVGFSDSLQLAIWNAGDTLLQITKIYADLDEYTVSFSDTSVLPGETVNLIVQFSPTRRELFEGSLTIESNDPKAGIFLVDLSGQGLAPEIAVSPDSVDFGVVSRNDTVMSSIVIENKGERDLHIDSLYFSLDTLSAYFTDFQDTIVNPSTSVIVNIYYAYRESPVNIILDTLNIMSNDPGLAIKKVGLKAKTYRTIFVPDQIPNIQSAIDQAWDGDTVLVSPGLYRENIQINEKSIALISHYFYSLDDTFIDSTIITSDTNRTVITLNSIQDTTMIISGFTIRDGEYENGGGLHLFQSNPRLSGLNIVNNRGGKGGGIFCRESNPTLAKVIIDNNFVVGSGAGIYLDHSEIYTTQCIISNNHAAFNEGGGICGVYSNIQLYHSEIYSNSSAIGGGLYISNSNLILVSVSVSRNSTDSAGGGGLYCDQSDVIVKNVIVSENIVTYGDGGGIKFTDNSNSILQNVIVSNNRSVSGGGIECRNNSNPVIENSIISGNSAEVGGGLRCKASSNPILIDVTFSDNQTETYGGAIRLESSDSLITINRVVFENNFSEQEGGAISLEGCATGIISNCLFLNNSANSGGGAILCNNSDLELINVTISHDSVSDAGSVRFYGNSNPVILNSIIWDYSPNTIEFLTDSYATLSIAYSDIAGGFPWTNYNSNGIINWLEGNLDADPLFVDTTMNDYRLQDESPCISAGIDSILINDFWYKMPIVDLNNELRPNPAGSLPDMGSYENPQGIILGLEGNIKKIPQKFVLSQNYLNPFNPKTMIYYELPITSYVYLNIYNLLGQKVATLVSEKQKPGYYQIEWDASGYASGVYYYRMTADQFQDLKRMILLK
jgi:predicted outer membrane repeat protein